MMKTALLILAGLMLTSCGISNRAVTVSEATYLSLRPHEIIVQMDSSGAFTTTRSLPYGNNVKVTLGGKEVSIDKLRGGQRIRISRDAESREVVAIDAI